METADETTAGRDADVRRETIRECVGALRDRDLRFILIGGAAGLLEGSGRATSDIDLLFPAELDLSTVQLTLLGIPGFAAPGGALLYRGRVSMPVDLLHNVVLDKTYADFAGLVMERDGVALFQFDAALAVKRHCFYYRQDDANGQKKQMTDLLDAAWLSLQLEERHWTLSDRVAALFRIGRYHLLLVRFRLGPDDVARLVAVGAQKLVRPWAEETAEQKEYFACFGPPGACPLTGPLLEDEDEGD